MFKGFSDSSRNQEFHGFPNLNFQMNNEAYGFSGCTFWLDAAYGLNTQTDLGAVSRWVDKAQNRLTYQHTAGQQPRLIASDPDFNNLPSIQFQSNIRFLDLEPLDIPTSPAITIALAIKKNADMANANTILESLGNASVSIKPIAVWNGASIVMNSGVNDNLPHIVVITNNEIVVDGVQTVTGNWIPSSSFKRLSHNAFSRNALANVAEIIIYNGNLLNSDQCIQLSDRLNSKYAIY